jgi:hypothetical protein
MKLVQAFGNPDNDTGRPFVYADAPSGKPEDAATFFVRRITTAKSREIENSIFGRKRAVRVKRGMSEVEQDIPKSDEVTRQKAYFALIDTKNVEVGIGDDAAAAEYSKILGREVKKGETVCLDGKWGQDLKEFFFAAHHDFAAWVVNKGEQQEVEAKAEEDDLGKT